VTPSTEGGAASLAAKRLDLLSLTMLAIANESMNANVCIAEVGAMVVGTGETLSGYAFGSSSPAFDFAPGAYRPRRWLFSRRGSGGETTGGAIVWAARLEQTLHRGAHRSCFEAGRLEWEPAKTPQQRQREEEEAHE
jgi:hypothetical protein